MRKKMEVIYYRNSPDYFENGKGFTFLENWILEERGEDF